MSVQNIGGVVNLIQGLVGLNAAGMGGFASASARQNQGVAMFPDQVRELLARADLASSLSAKLSEPIINSGSVNNLTTAATAQLVGVVIDNNDSAITYVQLFNAAAPTLGTTVELADLSVPNGQMGAFLFASTPAFSTALTWEATTAPHGNTRSTSGKVTVMVVYVA